MSPSRMRLGCTRPLRAEHPDVTLDEALTLQPGDLVEWRHHLGGWRLARFAEVHPARRSLRLVTDVGCDVYRTLDRVRRVDISPCTHGRSPPPTS